MKTRRLPLIIGLVLALGTGVLLLGYLTSLRPSGSAGQTRPVLVATHEIPAGAAITSDLYTVEQRIATQVDTDATRKTSSGRRPSSRFRPEAW
jgi:Flp pilus assembly protein CpaB